MARKPVKIKMEKGKDILNELNGISPAVAAVPFINVFKVHPGYFEAIETELKARISADGFYGSKPSFSIPHGYFDGLAGSILQKIKAEENETGGELNAISTLVAGIGNENVYTVPQGYFEGLNFVPVKEQAKLVQMNPSRSRSIFKYAAAAVITGLLGISVINITGHRDSLKMTDPKLTASVEVQQKANDILKNGTMETEFNNLSDKEIDQYFSENGQDVNAAMVASSVKDDNKLPEASDYLLDENTLDNYLKENNLKN